jgi:FkbM family methyltransferase
MIGFDGGLKSGSIARPTHIMPLRTVGHQLKRTAFVRRIRGAFFDGSTIKRTEPEVWQFLHGNIKPGWTCVDVGANRGEFSFLMAERVTPSGLVYSFELHPENAQLLQSNLWRYRRRVRVENVAVTDGSAKFAEVFAGRNRSHSEWNVLGPDETGHQLSAEFRVRATSLDEYFAPGTAIHLVKIDVEGAASGVLAGMARILRLARPIVILEVHNAAEWAGRKHLDGADYAVYDLKSRTLVNANNQVSHCVAMPKERQISACFTDP